MKLIKRAVSLVVLFVLIGIQRPVYAEELTSPGYKLEIDNNGLGYDSNSTKSTDQSGSYDLSGSIESFDAGSGDSTGSGAGDYKLKTGLQPTFEANVSEIAVLSNTNASINLYSKLVLEIDPNDNPTTSDGTLFAVQIDSSTNFTNPKYVNPVGFQMDSITNSNLSVYYAPCAQTSDQIADDTRWDCGTVVGLVKYIQGLAPNTQYCARVIAKNGDFTNSEPGTAVCATTSQLSLTFSIDPNTTNFGYLSTNTVTTAASTTTLQSFTNFETGYTVQVRGQGDGVSAASSLYSSTKSTSIASTAVNLDSNIGQDGYGLQATIQTGTPTIAAAWVPNSGGHNATWVGQISRTASTLYSSSSAMTNGTTQDVIASYKATVSPITKSATDYKDTLTYTMGVNP